MKSNIDNIKLGGFVLVGFALLLGALFFIGQKSSLFGNDAQLKVRFYNANGLLEGNNVLFSGINAGRIKSIVMINGNTIEVTALIKKDIFKHIPKNSLASIGTDGLMGNKVLSITPGKIERGLLEDGGYLQAEKAPDIDQMLLTLSESNDNIAVISAALKVTALRISESEALNLIESKDLADDLKQSMVNIRKTTENTQKLTLNFQNILRNVQHGKGAMGKLFFDETFSNELALTLMNLKEASITVNQATNELNSISNNLNQELENGKGPVAAMLKDSTLTIRISNSLENIEKGTEKFNQNMEALKHNFLFRGYFKKQEKMEKAEKEQ